MLARLGSAVVRRRRLVLVAAVVLFALSGAFGGSAPSHLSAGGFDDPGAESSLGDAALADVLDAGPPNVILLVTAEGGDVDDPAVAAEGLALTEALAAEPHISNVASYWSLGSPPPLKGVHGDKALVLGRIDGTQDEVNERVEELAHLRDLGTVTSVEIGGFAQVFQEVGHTVEEDLVRAEMIALPITL